MNELTMGLEDLKDDLEGNQWQLNEETGLTQLVDDEGNFIEEGEVIDNTDSLPELMAVESLLKTDGLVSREAVERFQEYLPATTPLASFTAVPTRVNYGVAVESVTGAIHLVASAGVIALIGGLGVLLYKLSKQRKLLPKNDLDKKLTVAYASIEEKLKVALQECQNMHPDIKHPTMNWSRQDATVHVAASKGLTECAAMILGGKYPFMPDRLYGISAEQGKAVCDFIENQMIKPIDQLMKQGTEDDITALEQALNNFKVPDTTRGELVAYCKSLGIEVGDDDAPSVLWSDRYNTVLERDALKEKIGTIQPNHKPMGDVGLRKLLTVQERIAKLHARLDKSIKTLQGKEVQVGGNYATKLKELVQKVKAPLSSLSDTFVISDAEVKAFNTCVQVKGNVVGDGFNFLKNQYQELAGGDKENVKAYKECVVHLTSLFSTIKEGIK